ncbi:MAG TPA: heterodisulfide reductase-related iron-sulfur binding cluster [Actinomycetota bacterium]|nr:heterodisulfide reductase-related iron-sulfur binding cluster [Actinomycetota bacterium]
MLVRAAILLLLGATALALAARRGAQLARMVRLGRPVDRRGELPRRVGREATEVLGQRKLLQRFVPGAMHALIFWGFLILLTTILEVAGQVIDPGFELPIIGGTAWLGFVQDLLALAVLVGIGIALAIRLGQRPERFVGSHTTDAYRILGLIFLIIATLFLARGARIVLGYAPETWWTPISSAVANLGGWVPEGWHRVTMWSALWLHLLIILGFLVYLGYSKHLHIATSAINVWLANTRPRGTLAPLKIDLEAADGDVYLGAATISDLTRKEALDLYACTECGRCQAVCPAWNTGKPLSPKLLVMNLRDHLFEQGPRLLEASHEATEVEPVALVSDIVDDEVVWACTTCGACMQECPVDIEHVDTIVDLRRNLVMAESRFPPESAAMLRNLESTSNPWGLPQDTRADWADGLDVRVIGDGERAPEYLYWVGCAGSFDDRAKAISRSVVRILARADVSFAILGQRELCTGDPARRIGNEYLFQTLAEQNVETLAGAEVTTVIANCPHCFNTLRNEYPVYGGTFEVIHHSQLFARLVAEGRLRPSVRLEETIAYHDPCYLGRHNDIYRDPRRALGAIPGVETVEMPRHGERALCCGAGGARMWMEERIGKRINQERVEEAASTGADTIAVSCPYCLVMLDDGARARTDTGRVEDLAQVLDRSCSAP